MKRILEKAEILCVGTELLMGDIVNTNAAFLSRQLATLGIGVYRQAVVGDNPARLFKDLKAALSRVDLVVLSGGLGPTFDDLTKETAAAVFGREMTLHQPSLDRITAYFAATGRTMTENNKKQAVMPTDAVVFDNEFGTAPGLALEDEAGRVAVLLPGPPGELEPMFCEKVEPFLRARTGAVLVSRNVRIMGMGESAVEAMLPAEIRKSGNPTVAPYCDPGEVRLRVTAKAPDKTLAKRLCDEMIERLKRTPFGDFIYGIDVPSAEAALISELARRHMTVATAESCTGGLLLKRLTDIPGCSAVVAGGVVTYQTREKEAVLGIPHDLIERYTVVSEPVARAMAEAARRLFDADVAIATTGYAGPGGGTEKEPVGTVYVAVATAESTLCRRLSLSSRRDRDYIRRVAASTGFVDALRILQKISDNS